MIFACTTLKHTKNLARLVSLCLNGGETILLNGEIGAGKTTFTQYLAGFIGVKKQVNSPTFTIIKEYLGKFKLFHIDMYRIESMEEAEYLGVEDCFNDDAIVVIEWNKYNDLRGKIITIDIENINNGTRIFRINGLNE